MNRCAYSIFLCIFAILSGGAIAMGDDGNTITVVAEQVTDVEEIKRDPGFIDIIDTSEASKKFESLSEVLSERAGINVQRYGSSGTSSTVSIRGSSANQVQIYLDGIPMNDSKFGEVNLETLPLDNIERIEVYRGVAPARFGTPGIGGVVNLVTKKATGAGSHSISAGYGSFSTSKLSLYSARRFKKFGYIAFLNRSCSDGDFEFIDDNGTPVVNTSDDRKVRRKNNFNSSWSATGKLNYPVKKFDLSLASDFYYKDQGLAGMYNNSAENVTFTTLRNISSFTATSRNLLKSRLFTEMKAFYAFKRDTYKDPENEIGLGAEEQTGHFDSTGVSLCNRLFLSRYNPAFSLLVSLQRDTYYRVDFADTDSGGEKTPKQKRTKLNITLEDELSFFSDTLVFTPQVRGDIICDSFTEEYSSATDNNDRNTEYHYQYLWKAGGRYYLVKKKDLSLYAQGNISAGYRMPTFTELFGDRGYIIGNPDLKPESSVNRDAGAGLSFQSNKGIVKDVSFRYAFFSNTLSNNILFISNSQWTMKGQNISGAQIRGHEFILSAGLLDHLRIGGTYTMQEAKDRSDIPYYRGMYLPNHPVHSASIKAKAYNRLASLTWEFLYEGYTFRDRLNSEFYYVKHNSIHNLMLQIYPSKELTLSFEVKNLGDNFTRDNIGYPLPGRSYYGTVSYTL